MFIVRFVRRSITTIRFRKRKHTRSSLMTMILTFMSV